MQWSSDSDIVKRHFAHLGIRAGLLLGVGAITIPITVNFVANQIGKCKNAILQAAQSDVGQKPPLVEYTNKVLDCVDAPDETFGDAVLQQFGGKQGLRSIAFKLLFNYIRDDVMCHALRMCGLYSLGYLAQTPTPIGTLLSLDDSPFPSYIALWDFGNSSHTVWCNRVLFFIPSILMKYTLPLSCCANPDITDAQMKSISSECTAVDLAKWTLALNAPFLVISVSRLLQHALKKASTGKVEPLPPSAVPAGKGKSFQQFRSRGYLNAVLFEIGIGGANVLMVYAFARFGPKLGNLTWVFDPSRGSPYAWGSVSECLVQV